jgi:hypothetical protein
MQIRASFPALRLILSEGYLLKTRRGFHELARILKFA